MLKFCVQSIHKKIWHVNLVSESEVYVQCKTVNTCALCRSFVSSSIVSGRIIVFLSFILYDVTGDRFNLNLSRKWHANIKILLFYMQNIKISFIIFFCNSQSISVNKMN